MQVYVCVCEFACLTAKLHANGLWRKEMPQRIKVCYSFWIATFVLCIRRVRCVLTYPDLQLDTLVMPKDRLDLEVNAHS